MKVNGTAVLVTMKKNYILIAILLPLILHGCVSPVYLKLGTEDIPKENMAKIVRDQPFLDGTILTIDTTPLPNNSWAPPDVYVKEGSFQVTYTQRIFYDRLETRKTTEYGCIGLQCGHLIKNDYFCKMRYETGSCNITLEGGKVYYRKDIINILATKNCKTLINNCKK